MRTDEILALVRTGRDIGSYDPVFGQIRDFPKPASVLTPQVRLLEALAGIDLTASETYTLRWLLNLDTNDNIAAMIEKRVAAALADGDGGEAA
jgi:hypothetical protein